MKQIIKLVPILILIVLASPLVLLKGCGTVINGGACGPCPDTTAPLGSTILAPTDLANFKASTGGCYPTVSFQVLDSFDKPLNNICIEIFTDGASAIAKHTSLPDCSDVLANPITSMITRTNSSGIVVLAFAVPTATVGDTFFVQAASCSIVSPAVTVTAE